MDTIRCYLACFCLLAVASVGAGWAGTQVAATSSRITESDIAPYSRPMSFSQLLDDYLITLQERLKDETKSI